MKKVVAAIDFGTSGTTYAFAFTDKMDNIITGKLCKTVLRYTSYQPVKGGAMNENTKTVYASGKEFRSQKKIYSVTVHKRTVVDRFWL